MNYGSISFFGVFLAAVSCIVIGVIWYAPFLFGNAWNLSMGLTTKKKLEAFNRLKTPAYVSSFVGFIVMALILALLIRALNVTDILNSSILAVFAWFGFIVPVRTQGHFFGGKPLVALIIDLGYNLVILLAMSAILTVV